MSAVSASTGLNILVYNGSGVSAASRDHTINSLKSFLGHRYDIQFVTPKSLRDEPWTETCALLVFPGGRDLPYLFDLGGEANRRIREWVKSGGRYLGFCAGAYYASARVEFEVGTAMEVVGDRELNFYPGTCQGTVFPGFAYETEAGARQVQVGLNRTAWRDHWPGSPESASVWYNGGGCFVGAQDAGSHVQSLATYSDLPGQPSAGVRCQVGAGVAVLWAVHPEHPSLDDEVNSATFADREDRRKGLLRATLAMLDLEVLEAAATPPSLLPLFLTSPNLNLVGEVASSIATKGKQVESGGVQIGDRNDTFELVPQSSAIQTLATARATLGSSDPDELRTARKDIVVCSEALPSLNLTPLFDLSSYFSYFPPSATSTSSIPFGGVLLYGEAVTSTQTMLDKNDKFLSTLPTGLACLASHQIAGRGRGGNSWVSSAGCLQFSLILRLAMTSASKIVFVQYLFGLAVVEAIRRVEGYEEVPVCLKWPNDIYANLGTKRDPELKKIGGILVNSSYAGKDFTLVVGCGVNTGNPRPTTSVNEVISLYNSRNGTSLPPFTQERLLALILTRFSEMWQPFLDEGFAPFTDSYLTHWIHSNQKVTIQATNKVVRIVGITPEHGLLRTVPADLDRNGKEIFTGSSSGSSFIDLQPDGNGFDMVKGLLVSR
ncbi:class II aaRS and biotin synthetase [Meredithblackwellia eburnea MCA 4105]